MYRDETKCGYSGHDLLSAANAAFGVIEFSLSGDILGVNGTYLAMSGHTADDFIGKSYSVLFPAEYLISFEHEAHRKRLKAEGVLRGVFAGQRKDGRPLWMEAAVYLAGLRPDGKAVAGQGQDGKIIMFCFDVTGREEERAENAAQLEALRHSALIAEYGPDGRLFAVNGRLLAAYGGKERDMLGKSVRDLLALAGPGEEGGPDKEGLPGKIWRGIGNGHSYSGVLALTGGSRSPVWLQTVFTPVFSPSGKLRKVFQFSLDISAELRRREERDGVYRHLAFALECMDAPVCVTDGFGNALYANRSFVKVFGWEAEDMAGRSAACVFGPQEGEILQEARAALEASGRYETEAMAYPKDGQRQWVSVMANLARGPVDGREYVVMALTDITETKLREVLQNKALQAMAHDATPEETLGALCLEVERVLPGVSVAVSRVDKSGRLHAFVAPSLPLPKGSRGLSVYPGGAPSCRAAAVKAPVAVADIAASRAPKRLKALAGELAVRGCLAVPILTGVMRAIGVVSFYYREPGDVTAFDRRVADALACICATVLEQHESRAAVRALTFYDPVTGLPNRNLLLAGLDQLLSAAGGAGERGQLAVAYVNIDRFKRVNKECGFQAGNEVLRVLAKRFNALKGPGGMVGHLSAAEYVFVLPGCCASRALELGRKIQAAAAEPCLVGNLQIILRAGVGISVYPDNGSCAEHLVNNAVTALMQAPKKQAERVRLFEGAPAQAADISLETCLYNAVSQGLLELHYQPQVYMRDGRIYGVEALCRWHDKERGRIPPDRFIPLAEESGLIEDLSDWVLREACRQLGEWRRRGVGVPVVSVNLSSVNFHDQNLPERVLRVLGEHGLSPRDLILELTESVLLDDDPATIATIHRAHGLGLRFSLDDFGTGYSSLSYLRNLPITELKLDQSFVRDLHRNEVSQRLSKAVMHIGESLNLTVLAEGIENGEQYRLLKEQNYHVAQGYLLSKPVPPKELEGWLESWRPGMLPGLSRKPMGREGAAVRLPAGLPIREPTREEDAAGAARELALAAEGVSGSGGMGSFGGFGGFGQGGHPAAPADMAADVSGAGSHVYAVAGRTGKAVAGR